MPRRTLLLFALAAVVAPRASAQYVPYTGTSVGVGFGVYPRTIYGGFGYFPGQYNGFYTNGFSAYGPPVPTYGIVPGAFGANDYKLNNISIQNGASIGLGTPGAGGAGPRRRHWMGGGDDGFVAGGAGQSAGVMDVRLPTPDAELFFEGQPVQQQGINRRLVSPPIAPGVAHFYTIKARWKRDGEVIERSQAVSVRAGQITNVDFAMLDRPRPPALPDGRQE